MSRSFFRYPNELQCIQACPLAIPVFQFSQSVRVLHVREPKSRGVFLCFGVVKLIQCVFSGTGGTTRTPRGLEGRKFGGVAGEVAELSDHIR